MSTDNQAQGTGAESAPEAPADSGQGAYDPHMAELEARAAYWEATATMLDRIHGQMIAAEMGTQVTGEVTAAQEACTTAAEQLRAFREAARTANEGVRDARRDAAGQAATNDYLTAGR